MHEQMCNWIVFVFLVSFTSPGCASGLTMQHHERSVVVFFHEILSRSHRLESDLYYLALKVECAGVSKEKIDCVCMFGEVITVTSH